VIAERDLLHPFQDEDLDLRDLRQVEEGFLVRGASHGTGT
jgi:hypothetical protein